jgi:hypothetical protein
MLSSCRVSFATALLFASSAMTESLNNKSGAADVNTRARSGLARSRQFILPGPDEVGEPDINRSDLLAVSDSIESRSAVNPDSDPLLVRLLLISGPRVIRPTEKLEGFADKCWRHCRASARAVPAQ